MQKTGLYLLVKWQVVINDCDVEDIGIKSQVISISCFNIKKMIVLIEKLLLKLR